MSLPTVFTQKCRFCNFHVVFGHFGRIVPPTSRPQLGNPGCNSQDTGFLREYTRLLPKEVQSLYWNQEQCTVYPVVVLRKVDGEIREDHFITISDGTKQDFPVVELANKKKHEHYRGLGISVDIEFELTLG